MILSNLPYSQYQTLLTGPTGLTFNTGPFTVNVRSKIPSVAENLFTMYQSNPLPDNDAFIDFHVSVAKPGGVRNYIKPQVQFYFDGLAPFKPLPFDQAFPMLEWGLNLCASSTANQYLIIHAAVVEKNGAAMILPGPSGSGKSTLCAALINSGWRLLSDELTLISRATGLVEPLVRPVSLKNRSIDIIKSNFTQATFTNVTRDTAKGTVAHMRAPESSVRQSDVPAKAKFLVFPKYVANSPTLQQEFTPGQAFMQLIDNCFNYSLLGENGFRVLSKALYQCRCFSFEYSDLTSAIDFFDNLASDH